MVKEGNWFKRHWIISTILGIIVILIVIGAFLPGDSSSNAQNNIDNTKINSEADYGDFMSTQSNRLEVIMNGASSTFTKLSHDDISLKQASDLIKTYKVELEKVRINLVNYEPPEKYKDIHTRYIKAIDLIIEAMDLYSNGILQINADLIEQGTQKIKEANSEISTITEFIKVTA